MTTVLLSGATGTFGEAFLKRMLPDNWTIRAYSRDEHKQHLLSEQLDGDVRWLLGDVRDKDRLTRAMEGCDLVVHAAALKHVTAGELNPDEFVKTNVLGTLNVIEACHTTGVEKAVLLSSDKAVHPANLYGATKLCAEKLWLAANTIPPTRFSAVRYGNVKGSRGSILAKEGPVRLTDARATRFWMEASEAVDLVLLAIREMQGGEVFVPKLRAERLPDVLENWADLAETGLRPGEKLHEMLIAPEEVPRTFDAGNYYVILPPDYRCPADLDFAPAIRVPPDFSYTSEVSEA